MRTGWLVALLIVGCGRGPSAPGAAPGAAATAVGAAAVNYPPTERRPVTDRYGELEITDDYRWLEAAEDPRVAAWTAAQNAATRRWIDALPDRGKIRARVTALLSSDARSYLMPAVTPVGVLALSRRPPKQQPLLVRFADPADAASEQVVLDPSTLDPSGHTAIDFFLASRDGARVAVSLSAGGSESGDLHFYDVATGAPLPDVLPRVNGGTAGGSAAWNADGTGLWYTRYPLEGERPPSEQAFYQQLFFHRLGAPVTTDVRVLGPELSRISELTLRGSRDGRSVLVEVAEGDGGDVSFFLVDAGGARRLFSAADKIALGRFAPDGALYVVSNRGAPRGELLRLAPPYTGRPTRVLPEGEAVLVDLAATRSYVYLVELVGGPSQLRRLRIAGGALTEPTVVAAPFPIASIYAPRPIGDDDVLFSAQSYTAAPGVYRYDAAAGVTRPTALVQRLPFSMDDVEVVRESCTSADGTRVPLNVLHKRGLARDGSHPALLTGYGGYAIGLSPSLTPLSRMWLDQGGVYAVANLRGGNEYGEAWHEAGKLTRKQNVFDDFYACAQALIRGGYTRPARLAITGRSNGGLLMGASLVQHPELYRAVVSGVGVYDMLRAERSPNGAFNVTEFGSVADPAQRRALHAYSPYHHVADGVAYPAVLLTTGANDPRVDPYHSRKLAARLQAATASARPVLLRESADVGHGMASPLAAVIEESTDTYAFLLHELGVRFVE